jgi:hypothetical protein
VAEEVPYHLDPLSRAEAPHRVSALHYQRGCAPNLNPLQGASRHTIAGLSLIQNRPAHHGTIGNKGTAMSSIIAKRREANREKVQAQRASKRRSVPSSQCAPLYLRRPAENKVSPSPILLGDGARLNPWEDLVWTPGKLLGGEHDSRVWKARLYPADKDPFG